MSAPRRTKSTSPEAIRTKNNLPNLRYSYPSEPLPYSVILTFRDYSYEKLFSSFGVTRSRTVQGRSTFSNILPEAKRETVIVLPMPKDLKDQIGLTVNGFERGPIGEELAKRLSGSASGSTVGEIGQGLQEKVNKGLNELVGAGRDLAKFTKSSNEDKVNTLKEMAEKVAKTVSSTSTDQFAAASRYALKQLVSTFDIGSNQFNSVAGSILNPKETLAFEGVNLRSHSFSWELYPESRDESDRINDIIRLLKTKILPETTGFGEFFQGSILKYPSVMDIDLVGVDANYFVRYKTSMVNSLAVQYGTGDDVPILRGGKPAAVSFSMDFTELEIETAEDYRVSEPSVSGITDSGA